MPDRRQTNILKSIVAPIAVAAFLSVAGNYFTTQMLIAGLQKDVEANSDQGVKLEAVIDAMQTVQIEMGRRAAWANNVDIRLTNIDRRDAVQYTKSDAQKDQALILEKLKNLERMIETK